jgi:hypothetical protein
MLLAASLVRFQREKIRGYCAKWALVRFRQQIRAAPVLCASMRRMRMSAGEDDCLENFRRTVKSDNRPGLYAAEV